MAYKVRRAKRIIGFGENKKERYVIVPDRGPVVTNKQICAKVVQRISTTEKMVSAILDAVVEQMIDHFMNGHSVQLEGLGTFIPSISTKSSTVEKEVNVNSIQRMRLRFCPCKAIQSEMDNIVFEFDVCDSTQDAKKTTETTPDESESEGPDII